MLPQSLSDPSAALAASMAAQEASTSPHLWLGSIHEHVSESGLLRSEQQRGSPEAPLRTSSLLDAISEVEGMDDVCMESTDTATHSSEWVRSNSLPEWSLLSQSPRQEGNHFKKMRSHLKALSSEFKIVAVSATDSHLISAARKLCLSDSTMPDSKRAAASPTAGGNAAEARVQSPAKASQPAVSPFAVLSQVAVATTREDQVKKARGSSSPEGICRSDLMRTRLVAGGSFGRPRPPSLINLHAAGDADDATAIALMSGGRQSALPIRCAKDSPIILRPTESLYMFCDYLNGYRPSL